MALMAALTGCTRSQACSPAAQPSGATQVASGPSGRVVRLTLEEGEHHGLSGLTADDDGGFWAVPERQHVLLRLAATGHIERRVPLDGVPAGLDLEALAWLGQGRFAIGTESAAAQSSELVLLVASDAERAHVVETVAIDYAGLPIAGEANRGIEGLCATSGHLLAAFEQVREVDGVRLATLVHQPPTGPRRIVDVALSTPTGKLSALACRLTMDALEVVAVERHFDVHRILGFALPLSGAATRVMPRIERALEGLLPATHNPEGIAYDGAAWLLVIDNHYGIIRGPNELLRVTGASASQN